MFSVSNIRFIFHFVNFYVDVFVVSKCSFIHFVRHLDKEGGALSIALSIEREKPQEERVKNVCLTDLVQKKITTMTNNNTKNIYVKMVMTAYELAMTPTVSLTQFKTFIKVQRQNGVVLVKGNINLVSFCIPRQHFNEKIEILKTT